MSSENSPVADLDGTIHYPRHALLSLCRKILLNYWNKVWEEVDITEDWDLVHIVGNLREKIDRKGFYKDWYEAGREFTVKEMKESSDTKIAEEYLLNPRETVCQPCTMKPAVAYHKELRGPVIQGDNQWKEEDAFLNLLLLLFESRSHGNLFCAV